MISEQEDNSSRPRTSVFGANTKQVAVLLAIDVAIFTGALLCRDFRNDAGKILQSLAFFLHTPIGIWIGIKMAQPYRKKIVGVIYWISVLIPPVLFIAPQAVQPLQPFFPFGLLPSAVFIQWLIVFFLLSRNSSKGKWPLPVAILFVICGVLLVVVNMTFATTEFGPLGMLFGNMLATPFFIIFPALIRIPANDDIKFYIVKLQQVTYGLLVLAWIFFLLRAFVAH